MAMLNNQRVMVVLWKQHLIQIEERGLLSLRAFSPKKNGYWGVGVIPQRSPNFRHTPMGIGQNWVPQNVYGFKPKITKNCGPQRLNLDIAWYMI